MAIRNLRYDDDPILQKKSRTVEVVDDNIRELIKDMFETMEKYDGVGLSAVQIGVLKRIFVVDTGEEGERVVLINPEIIEEGKYKICSEGCLSFPDIYAEVKRPEYIKVKGLDENGKEIIVEGKDLFAQALAHEYDHLNGELFMFKAEPNSFLREINNKFYHIEEKEVEKMVGKKLRN